MLVVVVVVVGGGIVAVWQCAVVFFCVVSVCGVCSVVRLSSTAHTKPCGYLAVENHRAVLGHGVVLLGRGVWSVLPAPAFPLLVVGSDRRHPCGGGRPARAVGLHDGRQVWHCAC